MNTHSTSKAEHAKTTRGAFSALTKALLDSRTPWYAKALPILVLLYAVLPFDLIPDIIPFAGWVDDLLIVPAGIWLAMRYIPQEVLAETGAELSVTIAKFKKTIFLLSFGLATLCVAISALIVFLIIWAFRSM